MKKEKHFVKYRGDECFVTSVEFLTPKEAHFVRAAVADWLAPKARVADERKSAPGIDFETEHDRAWDHADSGNYAMAEAMFRQLGDAGYQKAWIGLGFVLRDHNPMQRSSSDYSDAAVKALESLGKEPEDRELALVAGLVVLPLARYTIQAKLIEWANGVTSNLADSQDWSELAWQTKRWIGWTISLIKMVRPIIDSGALDTDSSVFFYETVHHISLLVNNLEELRSEVRGEKPNSYLADLATVGFAKYGRWS